MNGKITKYKRKSSVFFVQQNQIQNTQDTKPVNEIKNTFKIPEALLLGLIPILAYGLLYAYESSFLDYFGVPNRFINYDIPELIFFSAILMSLGLYLVMWLNPVFQFANTIQDSRVRFNAKYWGVFLIFMLALSFLYFNSGKSTLGTAFLFFGLLNPVTMLIRSIYSIWRKKHPAKVTPKKKVPYVDNTINLIDEISRRVGKNIFLSIVVYFVLFWFFQVFGYYTAYNQSSFYVIKTQPDCVAVYSNPDKFFCTVIDFQKKEFDKVFSVYYLQDLKGINIDYETIGPIRLKSTSIPTPSVTPTVIPILTQTP